MKFVRLLFSGCFVFLLAGVCHAQFFTLPGSFSYSLNSINQVFDVSPDGKIAVALRNHPTTSHPAFLTTFDPLTGAQFDTKSFGFGPLGVQLARVGDSLRVVVLTSQGGPRAVTLFDVGADGKLTQLASTQLTTSGNDAGSNVVLSGKAGAGFALVAGGPGKELVTFSLTDGSIINRLGVTPPTSSNADALEMVETADKRLLAFLGDSSTLRLVDASNPAAPSAAGSVALPRNTEFSANPTPGIAFSADAKYVFVGNGFIDFSAVDVAAQQVVDSIGGNFRFGRTRIFEGDGKRLLAVLSTTSGTGAGQPAILLVDATDPANLSIVNQFGGAFGFKTDMAFSRTGGRLYVAAPSALIALNVPTLAKAWEQPVAFSSPSAHQVRVFGQPEEVLGAWEASVGSGFTSLFGSFPADPPDVTVADAAPVAEGAPAVFTFALSAPTTRRLTIDYVTTGVTAVSPSDYAAAAASVVFEPGQTQKTVSVLTVNDATDEFDETFRMNVAKASVGTVTRGVGTATIIDDDPPPTVTLNDLGAAEGDSGVRAVSIEVLLSAASGKPVAVSFATSDGTATAGTDYAAASGELTFSPGETRKLAVVNVNGDTTGEADETVNVTLSAPSNATLGRAQGSLIILNDDPKVQFDVSSVTVTEGTDQSVTLNVTRAADLSAATTVSYETLPGAASDRSDFTAAYGTLRFAPNEATKSITVFITNDALGESVETFTVRLFNATGGVVGARGTATVRINSDESTDGPNPVLAESFDKTFFVRQHYVDFFNREPDAPGLAHWTGVVSGCEPTTPCGEVLRINVSGAFFLSIEFRETGFLVHRIYKASYGDATGTSTLNDPHTLQVPVVRLREFLQDTQEIGRGVVVHQPGWEAQIEANKQAFMLEFVGRQRFLNDFPLTMTPAQFVGQLNARAGGTLDDAERQALIDELTANNTASGRASVLRKVAEDPTLEGAERNRAFVLMQYFGYLRRDPNSGQDTDYTGYDFWLGNLEKFNGNFVQAELVKAFITSTEYRQRFGQ